MKSAHALRRHNQQGAGEQTLLLCIQMSAVKGERLILQAVQ